MNTEAELASYINIIHMQFPKAMAAVANQAILLVIRAKDYALDTKTMQDKLNTFLDRSNLRCGYSFPFYHFEDCLHHLSQTLYAATQAEASGIPVIYYGSVQTRHVLQLLAQNTELAHMAHPMIVELARSEKKSDRALVECLRVYLLNGRSISATVRALDLHRNTVIYRIQRLQEILNIQFDDMPEESLFSLMLSCLIVQGIFVE